MSTSNESQTHSTPNQMNLERDIGSRVARNSTIVMATQMLMKAFGFLFNVYIVRTLGVEDFGKFAAVMAFVAIFAIFSGFTPIGPLRSTGIFILYAIVF